MKFKAITQTMLEDFEKQYFDIINVPSKKGVHRNASGNIAAAEAAGWFADPVGDLSALERIELSREIDAKYQEFTFIDPNG